MKTKAIFEDFVDINHRKSISSVLLVFIAFITFYFAYSNFLKFGTYSSLIITEVLLGFLSLALSFVVSQLDARNKYLVWLSRTYIIIATVFIFYLCTFNLKHFIQVWSICVPLVSYLVLGSRWGFSITAVMTLVGGTVFYQTHVHEWHTVSSSLVGNFLGVYLITWFVTHTYEFSNHKSKLAMAQLASIDPLTGVLNRSAIETIYSKYKDTSQSLVIFDLDHFKEINDTYGHDAGDKVLVEFSKRLVDFFYNKGYVFRLGGEEFCILIPHSTKDDTLSFVKYFKCYNNKYAYNDFCSHDTTNDRNTEIINVKFSAGIASEATEKTLSTMMAKADKNLYIAKNNGRDCFVG